MTTPIWEGSETRQAGQACAGAMRACVVVCMRAVCVCVCGDVCVWVWVRVTGRHTHVPAGTAGKAQVKKRPCPCPPHRTHDRQRRAGVVV
jgi:hypothetical protein